MQGVNKDDLLLSINKIHSESIENQFKEKLEIIELSPTAEGDFIVILTSVDRDFFKSKSTIILHVSTSQSARVKVYDCFIHSVCFELTTSALQIILYTAATVAVTTMVAASTKNDQHSTLLAAIILATYSAINVRPHMPDFVENALNLLMVHNLKAQGLLIEIGTTYVLKKVQLTARADSISGGIRADSSERDD